MLVDGVLHGVRDRLLALRAMPNYAGLADESLLFIAEHARERRFRAGEPLFAERSPLTNLHFLVHGRVTTTRRGVLHQELEAPGAIGILAVLAGEVDGWGATAEADTLTLEIPVEAFLDNLEDDFALVRNALRILSGKILDLSGNLPVHPSRAAAVVVGEPPDHEPTLGERVILMRAGAQATRFATTNMDAFVEIERRMRLVRVEPGASIFERGDPSSFSFRIHHGCVRCTAANGDHVDVGRDMSLGVLDGLAARPRSYAARAVSAVLGYRTDVEASLNVFEMYPGLGLGVLRDFALRLIAR